MLGTLMTVATVLWCPLCEGATETTPEPVRLVAATETGESLTLTVHADGRIESGDPITIAYPDGWEGRHISNLHAGSLGLMGYDHHKGAVLYLSGDGTRVHATKRVHARGTLERRAMCVTPAGAILVLDSTTATLRVQGRDWAPSTERERGVDFVRLTGIGVVEAMAFADDGALYAIGNTPDADVIASRALFSISLHTGEATLVSRLDVRDLDALEWAQDGMLYATDARRGPAHLYRIDPTTGAVSDLGAVGDFTITALGRFVDESHLWRGCG